MKSKKNIKLKSNKSYISKKKSTKSNYKLKIIKYKQIIQDTIIYIQKYKTLDILTASDMNIYVQSLEKTFIELDKIDIILTNKKIDYVEIEKKFGDITNKLSINFRTFGTKNIEDLLYIVFNNDYKEYFNMENKDVFDIIKCYTHPISYKLLDWKPTDTNKENKKIIKNKIVEDFMICESGENFECFDLARTSKNFQTKVYGIKICFKHKKLKKTLIVSVISDDMVINCMTLPYLKNKIRLLEEKKPTEPVFSSEDFPRYLKSLTLKELLIYNNNNLYKKFIGYTVQLDLIKKKTISQIVKEFIGSELFSQRKFLLQLLIRYDDPEFQYLSYLLYDLLSNDKEGTIDTLEQTILFDSFPWNVKKFFRDAMKTTINYTKNLSNFDINKIPIEQQICLLKAPDSVKEKAMLKLKEVKAKSEDSGSKARQYLEGLLKIPFGIFKKEKFLSIMDSNYKCINNLLEFTHQDKKKDKYTIIEMKQITNKIKHLFITEIEEKNLKIVITKYSSGKPLRNNLISNICYINSIIKQNNIKKLKICHSGKKNAYMKENIAKTIKLIYDKYPNIYEILKKKVDNIKVIDSAKINNEISIIDTNWNTISSKMNEVTNILNESVYGHKNAKRQIERIIGQWITGKQTGYCFGFEGPPGVGKTSLARKGLAHCLKDEDGTSRPFAFIALGGSSNGSTLSGHNYTYVGSTWGRIVDILMDKKCMNPIIFIDELDKVSKTENGKEIIGILTHLIDPTQNETFQDKYFSNIDLDLSKALFIFSYNDVSVIDRILLDRIHRVKFDSLTLYDKLEITKKYILKEINENIGLECETFFTDEILKHIIEKYTNESGVRKLKEILFEIVSEINLELLDNENKTENINITIDILQKKYLKDRHEIISKVIHKESSEGVMNGLWANARGMGGIIPIECFYVPASNFLDLKLTGLQGDVMKESMNVAKTLAWKLTPKKRQTSLIKEFAKTKLQGIHIHCPEGSIPKDGPSAGTAITIAIYSLLNNKKIKNDIAITGEINLQGNVTIIGGLDLKILGGIKAGIKHFLFPETNKKDFNKFLEKFSNKINLDDKNITFTPVTNIHEVLKLVFV